MFLVHVKTYGLLGFRQDCTDVCNQRCFAHRILSLRASHAHGTANTGGGETASGDHGIESATWSGCISRTTSNDCASVLSDATDRAILNLANVAEGAPVRIAWTLNM